MSSLRQMSTMTPATAASMQWMTYSFSRPVNMYPTSSAPAGSHRPERSVYFSASHLLPVAPGGRDERDLCCGVEGERRMRA